MPPRANDFRPSGHFPQILGRGQYAPIPGLIISGPVDTFQGFQAGGHMPPPLITLTSFRPSGHFSGILVKGTIRPPGLIISGPVDIFHRF